MQGKTITFVKEDQTLSGKILAEYQLKSSTVYLTVDPEGSLHHVPAADVKSIEG